MRICHFNVYHILYPASCFPTSPACAYAYAFGGRSREGRRTWASEFPPGRRMRAEKNRASCTVVAALWMSVCSTYPMTRLHVDCTFGCPFTRMSPVMLPCAQGGEMSGLLAALSHPGRQRFMRAATAALMLLSSDGGAGSCRAFVAASASGGSRFTGSRFTGCTEQRRQ